MSIDGKAILKKLAEESVGDRGKYSVYVSKAVWKAFTKHCKESGVPVSQVLEELLRQFNTTAKKGK